MIRERFRTSKWNRLIVGLILLGAAGLKTYQLATSYPSSLQATESRRLFFETPELITILVAFEWFLGIQLVFRVRNRLILPLSLLLFSLFWMVSAYKILIGQTDCGCLGAVRVNPAIMVMVDSIALILLSSEFFARGNQQREVFENVVSATRRSQGTQRTMRRRLLSITSVIVFCTFSIVLVGVGHSPWRVGNSTSEKKKVVVLEPEKWLGKKLPVLEFIESREELEHGSWEVVFFHWDCFQCQQLMANYRSRPLSARPFRKVAFVELPPYQKEAEISKVFDTNNSANNSLVGTHKAGGQSDTRTSPNPWIWGRASDDFEWVGRTPTIVRLLDGVVVQ